MNHFAVFRTVLGSYLTVHFAQLIPYGGELFGANRAPLLAAATGVAVLLALGVGRRVCSLLLWVAWAALWNLNPLISNPSLPYVGLLLLVSAATKEEEFSRVSYWGVSFLLAAGYTFSGLHKLGSPSWVDGTALLRIAENPLARPGLLRDIFLGLPLPLLQTASWAALALEVAALPALFLRRTRILAWTGLVGMHLGILCLLDFADLTLGMLLAHLFVFDPHWLRGVRKTDEFQQFERPSGAAPGVRRGPSNIRFPFARNCERVRDSRAREPEPC